MKKRKHRCPRCDKVEWHDEGEIVWCTYDKLIHDGYGRPRRCADVSVLMVECDD